MNGTLDPDKRQLLLDFGAQRAKEQCARLLALSQAPAKAREHNRLARKLVVAPGRIGMQQVDLGNLMLDMLAGISFGLSCVLNELAIIQGHDPVLIPKEMAHDQNQIPLQKPADNGTGKV